MTSIRISISLAVLCSMSFAPWTHSQDISLFNGRDLSGWEGLPQFWSVKDGAIVGEATAANASPGSTFLVWKGGTVEDFDLSLKFQLEAHNADDAANSGIQFRAVMRDEARFALKGYQADLDPGTFHLDFWPEMKNTVGSILEDPGPLLSPSGRKTRSMSGPSTSGKLVGPAPMEVMGYLDPQSKMASSYRKKDWNECRVIAVGNRVQTFINGIPATDMTDEANRYRSGLLGLQMHNPAQPKTVRFKDIKLRVISPNSQATQSGAGPATATSDPSQPRIEVIKDQGPNATEWALTPLDETIPADIRQNLTFLREDLLDEGAKGPKASPESYRLASDYCNKLLTTLNQRELARVKAGYRAAQAEANKATSNQALDARRSHQMSWPQYAREESQRAALRENEADKSDVKKERIKVEWAERAEQMRKALDAIYAQLRAALRH